MSLRVDRLLLLAAAALLAACDSRDGGARTGFNFDPPAQPTTTAVLRADTMTADQGRWMDLDVLMGAKNDAEARATLQHVIDSVAAADTMTVSVQVTGFIMGPFDPEAQTADVLPAMRALWGPPDSVPVVGSRRQRYRTQFLLLRRFEAQPESRR